MAFQLSVTEIEGARAIAERALKSISLRDEQEKLNVWYAIRLVRIERCIIVDLLLSS